MSKNSEKERINQNETEKANKKELLKNAVAQARQYLVRKRYDNAILACFEAVKSASDTLGNDSTCLLTSYFVLADAHMGLGKLGKAEEFLVAAYWNLLKTDKKEESEEQGLSTTMTKNETLTESELSLLKSRLHRSFGRLFCQQSKLEDAIKELSTDIQLSSLRHGPESVFIAQSYFLLGSVFKAMGNKTKTEAFFSRVVELWRVQLASSAAQQGDNFIENKITSLIPDETRVDELMQEEALDQLRAILEQRETSNESDNANNEMAIADVRFTLGMLHFQTKDCVLALEFFKKAADTFQKELGEVHDTTALCYDLINEMEKRLIKMGGKLYE